MSTKKEKCCKKCLSTNGWMKGECFNGDCPCHQSESIEWKDREYEFEVLTSYESPYAGKSSIQHQAYREGASKMFDVLLPHLKQAITTAVAKDRELGNPYNSVSTWKEIGKNRGYWGFFKDQVISAREKELVEEVEKMKTYTGGSSVNEKDRRVNKQEVLSIINK